AAGSVRSGCGSRAGRPDRRDPVGQLHPHGHVLRRPAPEAERLPRSGARERRRGDAPISPPGLTAHEREGTAEIAKLAEKKSSGSAVFAVSAAPSERGAGLYACAHTADLKVRTTPAKHFTGGVAAPRPPAARESPLR